MVKLHRMLRLKAGGRPIIIPRKEPPVVFDQSIYQHPRYKKWRITIFKRDNFRCQLCGAGKNLEAHHIIKKSLHPELIFDIDNGITLCKDCHETYVTGSEQKCQKMFQGMIQKKKEQGNGVQQST